MIRTVAYSEFKEGEGQMSGQQGQI